MKLSQLVKVLPEFEPIRIIGFNKNAPSTIKGMEYIESYIKRKIPESFLNKKVYSVMVDDWDSVLTVGIIL